MLYYQPNNACVEEVKPWKVNQYQTIEKYARFYLKETLNGKRWFKGVVVSHFKIFYCFHIYNESDKTFRFNKLTLTSWLF